MTLKKNASLVTVLVLLAASLMALPFVQAASVDPVYIAGNPTCADLGFALEFKIDPPTSGTYPVDGFGSVTLTSDGTFFDWTSTFGIDAVIAKGGDGANAYIYDPESMGDTVLQSPNNASGGPAGLSHVTFCYDVDATPTEVPPTPTVEITVQPEDPTATPVPPTPTVEITVQPEDPTATPVPPTPTVEITVQPEDPTATPVPPTPTVEITVQPEDPTATPVPPTPTVQITVVPQDNPTAAPTSAPTGAPTATPEPAQAVLPAAGTGGAAGNLGGLASIALALAGGAVAWWRRSRV